MSKKNKNTEQESTPVKPEEQNVRTSVKLDNLLDESGLLHEDEPVFIIRGQDKLAQDAVNYYANLARRNGATTVAESSAAKIAKILKWQKENPLLVKLPD